MNNSICSDIRLSPLSLCHIRRVTVESLCRYLQQSDPFDHERRYGTVSGLLAVLEQIGLPNQEDAWGVTQNLEEIRKRVQKFLSKLTQAPVASPTKMADALSIAEQARMTPGSLNLRRYAWDLWEIRALLAGAPADLAEMGRGALRRQYFYDSNSIELVEDDLLQIVATRPEEAEERIMHFMVRTALSERRGSH